MDAVEQAFQTIDRSKFIPGNFQAQAGADLPLPIGYGQTISQPTTVRLMLEWLEPRRGDKVLDVGSGSGWTTALLSVIVSSKGYVYAVERVPELVEFGRDNAEGAGVTNAEFHHAGDSYGLPDYAPYDRILVSASADKLPEELIRQLKPWGKMVIPVHNDILEITKLSKNKVETKTHPGFVFVPLI